MDAFGRQFSSSLLGFGPWSPKTSPGCTNLFKRTYSWKFRGKDDSCRSVRDGWVHSGGAKPFRLFNLRITMPSSICGIDAWMKRELQKFLRSFCVCCVAKTFSLESQGFHMSLHLCVHYSMYIWYIPWSICIYIYIYTDMFTPIGRRDSDSPDRDFRLPPCLISWTGGRGGYHEVELFGGFFRTSKMWLSRRRGSLILSWLSLRCRLVCWNPKLDTCIGYAKVN